MMAMIKRIILFIPLLLALNFTTNAIAQGSIRADVFEQLEKAQAAQTDGRIDETFKILDKLKARSGKRALKAYEQVQLHNFYAYAWLAKEDFGKALIEFKKVLAKKDVPEAMRSQVQFTMAQLYLATDKPQEAIKLIKTWLQKQKKPSPDAYVLMAQAYLQLKQVNDALPPLLKAFEVAKQQKRTEKENWYALLQYIYNEKNDFANQEKALEILVERWPKAQWWLALGGAYALQEKEKKQLYAMNAAYQQGLFERGDYIVSMCQLLSVYGAPYYAAKALQKGLDEGLVEPSFKNLQRLADYYQRAQEIDKALIAYNNAISKAEDGETSLRLAYVYMSKYDYKNAVIYIRKALQQSGLRNQVQAELLLGEALYHDAQFDAAIDQFNTVLAATRDYLDEDGKLISVKKKRYHEQASNWLAYAQNEKHRQQELKLWFDANT